MICKFTFEHYKNNRLFTEGKETFSDDITEIACYTYDLTGNQINSITETLVPYTGQTEEYELYVFVEYIEIKLVTLNLNRYDGFKQLVQTLTRDKTVEVEYKYSAEGQGGEDTLKKCSNGL